MKGYDVHQYSVNTEYKGLIWNQARLNVKRCTTLAGAAHLRKGCCTLPYIDCYSTHCSTFKGVGPLQRERGNVEHGADEQGSQEIAPGHSWLHSVPKNKN